MSLTSDDPVAVPPADPRRPISDCDRLAASDLDPARPPEVPGVAFENIDAEQAIPACNKAIEQNPRIARLLYNLGRAYLRLSNMPGLDADKATAAIRQARLNYDDARRRGYVSALYDLAVLTESGAGGDVDEQEASKLLRQAAQQGLPLAMYNLGLHYKYGMGDIQQDITQADEWFSKAAESGLVSAMVERAEALQRGLTPGGGDGRRAIEWYQRAADAGSICAMFDLGRLYYFGVRGKFQDPGQALLWFGRAATVGDGPSAYFLATIMEFRAGSRAARAGNRRALLAPFGLCGRQ